MAGVSGGSIKTSGLLSVKPSLAQREKNSTIAEALIESPPHAAPIRLVWLHPIVFRLLKEKP